jgi:hypothetical protein
LQTFSDWWTKFVRSPHEIQEFIATLTCGQDDVYKPNSVVNLITRYQSRGFGDGHPSIEKRLCIFIALELALVIFLPISTVLLYFVVPQCLAFSLTLFLLTYACLANFPYVLIFKLSKEDGETGFYKDALSCMEGRAMAKIGQMHRFALVPEGTRKGDKIVVCTGARVPLVLRQTSTRKEYQIVGECYIHGIMEEYDTRYCRTLVIV